MKKIFSFLLAFVFFIESGSLIFANERKSIVVDGTVINIEENDDEKICSSLEEIGQVVVTLDKHTNIMTQKVTDPSNGKVLDVQTWDLSKRNSSKKNFTGQLTTKKSCYNWCGYNYWLDESPNLNCIYCEKHDGQNKCVYLDMASSSSIQQAYKFADKSEEIRITEFAIDGSVFLLLFDIFFPNGAIAKSISKSALVELGLAGGVITAALKLHQQALEADAIFSQI